MARIPQQEIDDLKQRLSLVDVAHSQGYKLKKQGADSYVCPCPFHKEKTPSCVITPSKNLFHCFGCNAAGSVLDWLIKTEHLSFLNGLVRLRELGKTQGLLKPVDKTSSLAARSLPSVKNNKLTDIDDDGQAVLLQAVEFYHQQLLSSLEAQDWLIRRGLNNSELVSHFKLGYAGKHGVSGESGILPSKSSREGNHLRSRLSELGVLRESTKQDHFRGCVVVPVIGFESSCCVEQRGKVLQLYGRRTVADYKVKPGNPKHLYLPSPLNGVWNESCLVNGEPVILCEALIDAMSFWVAGYRNVITAYGVNGFTEQHLSALLHYGVREVYIAYDRDEAGDVAAERLSVQLSSQGINCYRVLFPKGMDANEFLVKNSSPEKAFSVVLEQAQRMNSNVTASVTVASDQKENNEPQTIAPVITPTQPAAALVDEVCSVNEKGELQANFGSRQWRLRGWQKNPSAEVMKVNCQVIDSESGAMFLDNLDIFSAKQRNGFIKQAAEELSCDEQVIKRDIGRLLLKLEQLQDEKLSSVVAGAKAVELSSEEENAALELLKSPELVERVVNDLASCGVVGESSNLLVGYLAAVSRKLDKPLAVLIQSSSSAGKSSLMDAVLNLMPEEERVQYSAMTGQSLFYLGETNLQHKILAIAEEEGVRQAAYALKLLQSDGELTIASTGKDETSGELVTREYHVQGPVMLMLTTTAIDVDEELLNRCLVLSVNESREQTEAIHSLQRYKQTLEGLLAESEKGYLTELHQNAQRLLRPLKVVNPYANQLTFLSDKTRTRRDHMKYLTLIQSITLLHQYQREVKRVNHRGKDIEYIEVSLEDIKLANKLAHDVLGRTLDEMPPQTRKLVVLIKEMVTELAKKENCKASEVRFTRRDIREYCQWTDNQLKVHCIRLVELEYLLVHGGNRGHLLQYSLLWDGKDNDNSHLCGLLDVESLKETAGNNSKLD